MTTLIKHKRVEFSELFYDLVFVFAISKVTTLIEHLHNGILTWNSFLDFFNIWLSFLKNQPIMFIGKVSKVFYG